MDALYHLENDYKNKKMKKKFVKSRFKLMENLKSKVEELKQKQHE